MSETSTHEQLLDIYAKLAVRTGLNLQRGQQLVITAPLDAVALVRRITEHAYEAGASLVTTVYADEETTLARYRHAPKEAFDVAPGWLFNGMAEAFRGGAARLAIAGENPALLAGQDPDKLSRANKARSKAYRPALELITGFAINWCVIAAATPAWAQSVFPGIPEAEAMDRLWRAIFACTKADLPDPIAAWEKHNNDLRRRTAFLNNRRYRALKYKGPGTDLMLGLAGEHNWKGGGGKALNGVFCNANIPTEEVFTAPHKDMVDGVVCSSKPLSYQGSLIDGIRVRFERGKIVEMTAEKGQDAFRNLIDTDEGAARLGEVALVPHSSPISKSGLIFNNTLFDENAASHIAVGQSYTENIREGSKRSKDELAALGANASLVHVDWMIGSGELDVDGIMADGSAEPLMRKGEWAV
ncbi:MAG: aminopeptidase [Aestuariivirga sp.]|uniref:aminopeptidase n=1 Tax=Aestuariivirga sp. TaxID=2650926 RepID=UPI0025BA16FD|nr:aminopeptidase [Aestuariivirga sp.]MCA3559704.1 aminopeptidase [Aestuariivirga sp.]